MDYSMILGYGDKDGVPHIRGEAAIPCEKPNCFCQEFMKDVSAPWLCPKCKAHLSHSGICLNACHLSDASQARFAKQMEALGGTSDVEGDE